MFDDDEIDAGPAIRPTSGWVVIQPVEVQFMGAPSTLPAGTVLIDGFHGKVLDWARPVAGFPLPHSGVVAVRAARLKGPDGGDRLGRRASRRRPAPPHFGPRPGRGL